MGFHMSLKRQKGSALIFAIGLCTLVVILATSMILSLHHDTRRYEHLQEAVTNEAAMRSATAWALSVLSHEEITDKTAEEYEFELNGATVLASIMKPRKAVSEEDPLEEAEEEIAAEQELDEASTEYIVHAEIKSKGVVDMYTLLSQAEKGWVVVHQSTGVPL